MAYLHYNRIMLSPTLQPLFTQQFPRGSQAFNELVNTMWPGTDGGYRRWRLYRALIPADQQAVATIISRENAIICGIDWVNACFNQLDNRHQNKMDSERRRKSLFQSSIMRSFWQCTRAYFRAERCALKFFADAFCHGDAYARVCRWQFLALKRKF